MPRILKRLFLTLGYMTILPFGKNAISDQDFNGLAKYLSIVGLLIGTCLCVIFYLLSHLHVNNLLLAVLLVSTWLIITGGFHLDGLMDTADGVFSHTDQKRMLEIMRDSRVGNFGVITGMVSLLVKLSALYALLDLVSMKGTPALLGHRSLYFLLLLIPAWARWSQIFAIGYFPYLRQEGKGKIWHETMSFPRDFYWAIIPPALLLLIFSWISPQQIILLSLSFFCTVISGIITAFLLAKKLGGQTGDTYGAVVELAETGGLLFLSLTMAVLR